MDPNSDLDSAHGRVANKDRRLGSGLESTKGELGNALGVVVFLVLDKIRHANKGVANGFNPLKY